MECTSYAFVGAVLGFIYGCIISSIKCSDSYQKQINILHEEIAKWRDAWKRDCNVIDDEELEELSLAGDEVMEKLNKLVSGHRDRG